MAVVCIWADTREAVQAAYDVLLASDNPPQRITWRLAASFDGIPVGDECYAPDHPEIRAAYGEQIEEKVVFFDDTGG